ncbi:hypothetical protein THRCLA_22038, partial [Thraustotheca clavata]
NECQAQLQHIHELECPVLEDIDMIAKKSGTERDLLCLLLRIICTKSCENNRPKPSISNTVVTTYKDLLNMVHVTHLLEDLWKVSVAKGAKMLLDNLPKSIATMNVEELVEIAGRVNENSYSMDSWTDPPKLAAVCMFPLTGLINHSCDPNSTWCNAGDGIVAVKATRFIPNGEEITLSYIDVNQSRDKRQSELLKTKHFECCCNRCAQPLSESIDRKVDGVCCTKCGVDGILNITEDKTWICSLCNTSVSNDIIQNLKSKSEANLAQAEKLFSNRQYKESLAFLADILSSNNATSVFLHPSHYIVTKALGHASDCSVKTGDILQSYEQLKQAIAQLSPVVNLNSPLMATCYYDLGNIIDVCLKHKSWSDETTINAKQGEMNLAFKKCLEIRTVCFVPAHPLVAQVEKRI